MSVGRIAAVDLARVRTYMVAQDEPATDRIMSEREMDKYVQATLQLHYQPGINPHTGAKVEKAAKITVSRLEAKGPFWWTTPGLESNDDYDGATLFDWGSEHDIWVRPEEEPMAEVRLFRRR